MMEGKKENQHVILIKLWKRLRSHRLFILLSVLFALVTVAGTLILPVLIGDAIDAIVGKGDVDFGVIAGFLAKGAAVAAGTGLCQWLMNLSNNRIAYHVTRDIRNEAIEKIEHMPLSWLDGHAYGDVVSRIIADVDQFCDGLLMGFTQLFTGVITIVATLVIIFSIHPFIALLVLCLTPLSLFIARFIATHTYDMFLKQSETRGEETSLVEEMVDAQKVVKAFGYEDRARERFREVNDRLSEASMKATFFSSLTNPSTRFVNSLVYAAVALSGAFTVIRGGLTVGQLTALLSYATQYTKPFNEISGVITEMQNAIACVGRIFALLEEDSEPEDAPDVLGPVTGNVTLSHVDFSYLPKKPLIEDLNLSVRSGARVAIVGPTGSGKTTLINLLMRFYDVNAGSVRVDGKDVRNVTRQSLRAAYGMVLQETWLKNGTIRENITLGREGFTEEQIVQAAKKTHAYEFIVKMPQGFDTVISDEGTQMSQGQKQLLCITRVMIDLPSMLILDEATSSIDTRTEMIIQNAFSVMMENRTSFIVAHRLSTIENADVILVMKDGHIIEQGTHRELLAGGGFYSSLYKSQYH